MRFFELTNLKSKWLLWVFGLSATMHVLLIRFHYSTDTAIMLLEGNRPSWYSHSGRFMTALVSWVLDHLHINTAAYQIECTLAALIILSFCVHLLSTSTKVDDLPRKTFMYAAAYLTVFNPFLEDSFLFPEFVVFNALSMLFTILAVVCIISRPNIIMTGFSLLLLTIGLGFYQGSFGFFIPLSMVFVSNRFVNVRDFIKITVLIFAACLFAGLSNYLYETFITGSHNSAFHINTNILDRCRWLIFYIIEKFVHNLGVKITGIIFGAGCISLLGFLFWTLRQKDKQKRIQYLYLMAIIISLFILSLIPIIMSDYPGISPRSIEPLGGIVGIIIMFIILHKKTLSKSFYIGTCVIFILNFMLIILIDADKIVSNAQDLMIARQIIYKIHQYEDSTDENVDKIAIVDDKNPTLRYEGLKTKIYKYRIMSTDWAIPPFLSYLAKRNFKTVAMPDSIYQSHFKTKDWNIFTDDQLYINNDTLYMAIF